MVNGRIRSGFTLIELLLVVGLLMVLAFFVVPNMRTPLERSYLPESAERFRAFLGMTRAYSMVDGLRYRVRFLREGDEGTENRSADELRQPVVEVEREPVEYPGVYLPVEADWARSEIFLGDVWCYEIRFGEPTYESVQAELQQLGTEEIEEQKIRKEELGLEEDEDWVLEFEPSGRSDWMVFRLVDIDRAEFDERMAEEYPRVDVILDGRLGVVFLQRPLTLDETAILFDKGHSPVLRRDFMISRSLTENDVLEIDMR